MPSHKKDKNQKENQKENQKTSKKKIRIKPHPAVFVMFTHEGKPQITLKLTHRGASGKPFTSSVITNVKQ